MKKEFEMKRISEIRSILICLPAFYSKDLLLNQAEIIVLSFCEKPRASGGKLLCDQI